MVDAVRQTIVSGEGTCNACNDGAALITLQVGTGNPYITELRICESCAKDLLLRLSCAVLDNQQIVILPHDKPLKAIVR